MDIRIHLREGKRVDAEVDGYTVVTDQPSANGGEGMAPDPYTLFLVSIGTCAGFYVGAYCSARGIPTAGIDIHQHVEKDAGGRLTRIDLRITLPADFPAEQREGVLRAAGSCKVKKTLAAPPPIAITLASDVDQDHQLRIAPRL